MDKLGILGNIAIADGSTSVFYSGVAVSLPLPTLSKVSSNATLYYDTDRWGMRGSWQRARAIVKAMAATAIGEYIKGSANFDASAYLNLTPRFKVTVEAIKHH